jgi:long-chain fatty acid transport protein
VRLPRALRAVIRGGASGLGRALALEIGRRQGRVLIADLDADGARESARRVEARGGRAEVSVVDVGRVIHGCHVFAPRMRARGRGFILNAASSAGNAELAPFSIQVSALCPTFFENGRLLWWLERLAPAAYHGLLRFLWRRDLLQRIVKLATALLLVTAPSRSRASGLDAPQIGSAQSGPVSNDAAAAWWNPGRLGFLEQTELLPGVGLVVGSIGYQRELFGQYQHADNLDFAEPIPASDIDPSKAGPQQSVHDGVVEPAFDLFFATPLVRERLVVGAGISIPYAAAVDLPPEGPQRFAGESLFLATPHTTLALAVKANEVFSIGAGVSYVLGNLSLSKTQDFAALDSFGDVLARPPIAQENGFGADAPPTLRELDVLARPLKIDRALAHGISFNLGAALQATTKLALGLVYHHGANLGFRGKFRLDMSDDFFTQDLASQGLRYDPTVSGKALIRLRLPQRITFGAGYQVSRRFGLDGFVSYVFYESLDAIGNRFDSPALAQEALGVGRTIEQDLIRNWAGAVVSEVNGRIDVSDALRLSLTTGYHSPASPDATVDIISLDGHRIILGAGMAYRFSEHAALLAGLEGQFMLPRNVTASDFDLGNGTYRLLVSALMLHGQFRFGDDAPKRSGQAVGNVVGKPHGLGLPREI